MARRSKIVTIHDKASRDNGKSFFLTEMPSRPAEVWALKVLTMVAQSGADIPDAMRIGGMAGLMTLGIQTMLGGINFTQIIPLLDEMMGCVRFIPDLKRIEITRPLVDNGTDGDDIEEVETRYKLRVEVFNLHVNFSIGDFLSNLTTAKKE